MQEMRWPNPLIETTKEETDELLKIAMAKEPKLTRYGIGVPVSAKGWHVAYEGKEFDLGRSELFGGLDEVAAAADWLKANKPQGGSYVLKQRAEEWFKSRKQHMYVANGSFIAAAIGMGIKYEIIGGHSMDVRFGKASDDEE